MAYQKTEWKARQGSTLKRFEKSQETSKSVILNNAPTEITEPGTPFSAANMNKIEEGIHEAHEIVAEHIADTDKHISPTERLAWDGKQNALNRTISANVNNTYSAVDTGGDLSIGIRVDMETPSASNFQVVSAIYPLFQVLKIFANNIAAIFQQIAAHFIDKENPHAVTKAQVGLGNVDNTPDASKPISAAAQSALNNKQNKFIKSICETAAATVAKEITIAGYTLVAGDI
ncbi:MAG: hypothetical protein FWD36_03400, partial [Treponema sp.]|nr:hypothetical protein [Treponema sp.]